ncbi:hypothetical protein GDO78_021762 [Eleutherodactylus coqui]|uniref:Uncharacterized protein n=1 Tax=Eleutherodactylus coqui TaxID=57060 RepID=A0A8J6JSA0_ELECQ|nr:hypothetical protein GDO78_021762 [Eleutherodactylus coqui]
MTGPRSREEIPGMLPSYRHQSLKSGRQADEEGDAECWMPPYRTVTYVE